MVRKLVKTLLSLLLMTPVAALALGLGDVQLHSTLNQRLDADIKLLSVNPSEADTITVSLASYDDFAQVGLERPGYLMFLRFKLEQRPGGNYYIKLTSTEAIREPFLDFLIEVKWRSGRVLREYTLLLDPPVSHRQAAPVITAPETVSTAPTAKPAKPAAAEAEEEFVPPPSAIPVKPGAKAEEPAVAKKEVPKKPTQPETQAKPQATKPMPAAAPGGIVYGPIKANETLWRIAQKVRPSGDITVQQMMLALLKANPYAFSGNNINRLKKGFVLRIDDPAMIKAMSKAQAAREVARQTREWQDYRSAMSKKAKARKPVASAKTPAGAVAAAKKEPKLELVAPDGKSEVSGKGAGDSKSVQKDLMLALESSAAQRKENEALQKRVTGLEDQLNDMQRLLELKDADLAALQKQLREQGQAVTLPSEKSPEAATVTKPESAEKGEMPTAGEEKPATGEEQAAETKPVGEEMAGEKPAPETKPAGEEMAGEKPATGAETKKPEPATKPAPKKPAVKKPAPLPPLVEEPSVEDLVMENLNYLMIGGGVLFLLLLLLWFKRRRSSGFQESILTGGTSSMLNANEDDLASETSFLSDLAISGMGGGTIHSDEGEVDPLTEADVFMAYGRNQQAEEVLRKALEKTPGRQDLNAKLLEVYYNLKDSDKFVALATTAAAGLQSNEELWAKVVAMGHELAPDNGLFSNAGAVAAAAPASMAEPETAVEDVLDIGLDLDALGSEMESEAPAEDMGFDLGLDFGDLEEEQAAPEEPAVAEEESMDFDLDFGGAGEETAEEPVAESESEFDLDFGTETAEETSDFDFDLGALGGEEEQPSEELDFDLGALGGEEEQPSEELDFDLGEETASEDEFSMDFDLGATEEEASETSDELDLGDLGDVDFGDIGLDSVEEENVTAEAEPEDTLDFSDLGSSSNDFGDFDDLGDLDEDGLLSDSDEIATKLDLAQAYIEMGDNEGARSMLEEVAEAGNDEQKQQAQELLSQV